MAGDEQIPEAFFQFDVARFIAEHPTLDARDVALRFRDTFPFPVELLAEHVKLHRKIAEKLPEFFRCGCRCTTKSFEQSSSERCAEYKATLISGKTLLDLSGGLGVDDWAFARTFDSVVSIDLDTRLNALARHNMTKLGIGNVVRLDADAYEFIQADARYDAVYLDADRRAAASSSKTFRIADAEPSILKMKERLFELSETILLKLSPLADITAIIRQLVDVNELHVVSVDNEVREVLVVMKRPSQRVAIGAVDLRTDGSDQRFSGEYGKAELQEFSTTGEFFFEPARALIKAGLAAQYVATTSARKISKNSVYCFSDEPIPEFFGRRFTVVASFPFSKSTLRRYLRANALTQASVARRNFPMTVEEIRRHFELGDGDNEYFFFTSDAMNMKRCIHARRIE